MADTIPATPLTRAHLRAFVHGGSMKPGRPAVLRHPPKAIARALAGLPSDEAARFLALLPAGLQIAVATRLDAPTRARLARDCAEWGRVVPILQACHAALAVTGLTGQMTPAGRI